LEIILRAPQLEIHQNPHHSARSEKICAELPEATKMADRHALNTVLQAAKCGTVFADEKLWK